jgi:hypothetical protein
MANLELTILAGRALRSSNLAFYILVIFPPKNNAIAHGDTVVFKKRAHNGERLWWLCDDGS